MPPVSATTTATTATARQWHDANPGAIKEPETERQEDWFYCDFVSTKTVESELRLCHSEDGRKAAVLKKTTVVKTTAELLESDYEQDGDEQAVTLSSDYTDQNPFFDYSGKAEDLAGALKQCPWTKRAVDKRLRPEITAIKSPPRAKRAVPHHRKALHVSMKKVREKATRELKAIRQRMRADAAAAAASTAAKHAALISTLLFD